MSSLWSTTMSRARSNHSLATSEPNLHAVRSCPEPSSRRPARPDTARPDTARPDTARPDTARPIAPMVTALCSGQDIAPGQARLPGTAPLSGHAPPWSLDSPTEPREGYPWRGSHSQQDSVNDETGGPTRLSRSP